MSKQVPTAPLGKNGPLVSRLGFGVMGLSPILYGDSGTDEERFKVLDRVFELGCRFWDTAEGYGDNEDLLGKWFKRTGKRDQIFLATKFAVKMGPNGQRVLRNDPEYIRRAIDQSLKRLGVEKVDLWYCHRFDGKVPVETVVNTMSEAVKANKVDYLGLSECSAATLRRAHAVHPIHAVQIEYSPFTMDIESPTIALLRTTRELGIATVAYSPLGRGMLTGAYTSNRDFAEDDWRRTAPRFSDENFPKNLKLVTELGDVAQRKGCTRAQLVLAWLLSQGEDVFPIPGTKKVKYLEENMGALEVVLSGEEEREIRALVERAETVGERYPEAMMRWAFMDTPALEG